MLKLSVLILLAVSLSGCGTNQIKEPVRKKPISCMTVCVETETVPENRVVPDVELLENHTTAMDNNETCAANHKCLVEWIEKK